MCRGISIYTLLQMRPIFTNERNNIMMTCNVVYSCIRLILQKVEKLIIVGEILCLKVYIDCTWAAFKDPM